MFSPCVPFCCSGWQCAQNGHTRTDDPSPPLALPSFSSQGNGQGGALTHGAFFPPGRFLRSRRSRALCASAYAGGTRAHRTEMLHPCAAATARTAADSLLTQKAAQRPQERPQRRQEPPDVHGHTRRRRPYNGRRSPLKRTIAPPSRQRLTSVY